MAKPSVIERDPTRKADLAAIHIGKKQLGWDDDFYRSVMKARCGVSSSALLDFAGRKTLLAHMRACGWNGANAPGRAEKRATAVSRKPLTPSQRKMWSLWQQLADAGKVASRKMPALVEFSHRQTGVDRLEWLTAAQEQLVLESLKAWVRRPLGAKA